MLNRLPVIFALGGINPSGRSTTSLGLKRILATELDSTQKAEMLKEFQVLMQDPGLDHKSLLQKTLIRFIPNWQFPASWSQASQVSFAGLLPDGVELQSYPRAKLHPKNIQMSLMAVSDLLQSLGNWQAILKASQGKFGVIAASSFGQLDESGWGGLLKSHLQQKAPSTKQLPFGYSHSIGDFINAYILNNKGYSTGLTGACATFQHNLFQGISLIQQGFLDVALVGAADAALHPEIIHAFSQMGALATDQRVMEKYGNLELETIRGASTPFNNHGIGFVMGEAAHFFGLASAEFAIAQGLPILGAMPFVSCRSDGLKKSITSTGNGNFLTAGETLRFAADNFPESLQEIYVHAHATSTALNKKTEAHIFDSLAKAFGIKSLYLTSIKSHIGHSQGASAADQLACAINSWQLDMVPGTIGGEMPELDSSILRCSSKPRAKDEFSPHLALLNSKGFGGNNASSLVLSPDLCHKLLASHATKAEWRDYTAKNQNFVEASNNFQQAVKQAMPSIPLQQAENDLQEFGVEADAMGLTIDGQKYPFRRQFLQKAP